MWLVLSQFSALTNGIKNVLAKKATKDFESDIVMWALLFFSQIVLFPMLIYNGIPALANGFWLYYGIRIFTDTFALYFYGLALKHSSVSKITPTQAFSAVVVLISSIFINGEVPSLIGFIGVLTIIAGIYFLNTYKKIKTKDIGVRYIFISAFLWGLMPAISKEAIERSDTIFFTWAAAFGLMIVFTLINLVKNREEFFTVFQSSNVKKLLPVGFFDGLQILAKMSAINLTLATYASTASRTAIIFTAIFSYIFLKEKIKDKAVPILIILVGLILISVA